MRFELSKRYALYLGLSLRIGYYRLEHSILGAGLTLVRVLERKLGNV